MSLKEFLLSQDKVKTALDSYKNRNNVEDLSNHLGEAYVAGEKEFFAERAKSSNRNFKILGLAALASYIGACVASQHAGVTPEQTFSLFDPSTYNVLLTPLKISEGLTLGFGGLSAINHLNRDVAEATVRRANKPEYQTQVNEQLKVMAQQALEEKFGVDLKLTKVERESVIGLAGNYLMQTQGQGNGVEELNTFCKGFMQFPDKYVPTFEEKVVVTNLIGHALGSKELPQPMIKPLGRVFEKLAGQEHERFVKAEAKPNKEEQYEMFKQGMKTNLQMIITGITEIPKAYVDFFRGKLYTA